MKSLKEFVLSERKDKPPFDTDKADYAGAAKKIRAYAKKSGGIDKKDMLSIANQLDALSKKSTPKLLARTMANIGALDTDVRDKVKELMKESNCMEAMEEAVKLTEEQIKVGDYQTTDFDICPGAIALYKKIEATPMAVKSAKLQDMLFKLEKKAIESGVATDNDVKRAEELADKIMDIAKEMGMEKEHGYVQGHVDKIAKIEDEGEEKEMDEMKVRGKEVHDKTFANKTQADNFAKKHGGRVQQVGRVFYVFKEELEEAVNLAPLAENVGAPRTAAHRRAQMTRNPSKSGGSGYDLYHKDFSSAMKHAYDYAKSKLGIEIDPKEIDDKVASGPRKPSKGKTNSYRLKGKDGKKSVQIQVFGMDNGKYELNMYKEGVEMNLDEDKFTYTGIVTKGLTDLAKKNKVKAIQKGNKVELSGDKSNLNSVVGFLGLDESVELNESKTIDKLKQIVAKKQAMKIDGKLVDMFTASAITQVYDKVNDENKAKMDKLKVDKLASLAMKMMKREEISEETIVEDGYSQTDTLDGSDLSHSNVMDPDTLQAVNAHIGSIAEREYMNPKGAMIQLQNKLHLIGLTFDIPQFAEETGVEEVTITQFGGITGKSVTTPIDQLDNENPVENMKLRIEYETLKTNKVKLYAKIV